MKCLACGRASVFLDGMGVDWYDCMCGESWKKIVGRGLCKWRGKHGGKLWDKAAPGTMRVEGDIK